MDFPEPLGPETTIGRRLSVSSCLLAERFCWKDEVHVFTYWRHCVVTADVGFEGVLEEKDLGSRRQAVKPTSKRKHS